MTKPKTLNKTAIFLIVALFAGVVAQQIDASLTGKSLGGYADPNCNAYDQKGYCTKCSFRFYRSKTTGLCTQVSDWCNTWDQKTGDCTSCYQGYGKPVNGVCNGNDNGNGDDDDEDVGSGDIDQNCQCYDDDRNCNKCYEGYQLNDDGQCQPIVGNPDDNCAEYEYVDGKGNKYKKWFTACKKVCVRCNEGYQLNDDEQCQPIVGQPVDNCAQYGYVNGNGKWYKQWVQGCKRVCTECDQGYYLDKDNNCQQLPEGCLAADKKGKCTDCDDGYNLVDGVCEPDVGNPTDNCAEYGYVNSYGKWYKQWVAGCKQVCTECEQGYYLDKNNECQELPEGCLDADTKGKCTDCDDGYNLVDGVCEPDVGNPTDNCAEYGYVGKDGKWYKQWLQGCQQVCTKCVSGYYLDKNNECQELPEGCLAADTKGKCTKCDSKYTLNNGVCEINVGSPGGKCNSISLCQQINASGKYCDSCSYRSWMDKNKCCIEVNGYCSAWKEDGTCTACYGGYKINSKNAKQCILA